MFEKMFGMAFIFGVIAYAAYPGWTETNSAPTGAAAGIRGVCQFEEWTGYSDSVERKAFDRMTEKWVDPIECDGIDARELNERLSEQDGSPLISFRI